MRQFRGLNEVGQALAAKKVREMLRREPSAKRCAWCGIGAATITSFCGDACERENAKNIAYQRTHAAALPANKPHALMPPCFAKNAPNASEGRMTE